MEDQLEKEARYRQLMAHSSHDSAIDMDSVEWETEVVEFEKRRVSRPSVFFFIRSQWNKAHRMVSFFSRRTWI